MYQILLLDYGSTGYKAMVQLRQAVLRTPLGLSFTPEELKKEAGDLHLGIFDQNRNGPAVLVGCCILRPAQNGRIQLRQMAIREDCRFRGYGKSLLQFAEQKAVEGGFQSMDLHARKSAVGFYQKQGFHAKGDEFLEVGIPHIHMWKALVFPHPGAPGNEP
ncbi:MAG: GNAT family N-acetyltransferase [Chitinophagaceae bacterium]